MSMCLSLVALSDTNIRRLIQDPPLVWQVIAPDAPELYESARAAHYRSGLLTKLFGRAKPPVEIADLELSALEGNSTDLDKAWHGIHYFLTGTAWAGHHPGNFLVSGGTAVGDIDVGYGPARTLSAAQTREVRAALSALSNADLETRFNPEDMLAKAIYPEIWSWDADEDDSLGYLMEYVETLRGFLDQAVQRELGIVVYIS